MPKFIGFRQAKKQPVVLVITSADHATVHQTQKRTSEYYRAKPLNMRKNESRVELLQTHQEETIDIINSQSQINYVP